MRKGLRLKFARIERGLSQKELAKLSGVPYRTLQTWESDGTHAAAAGRLKRVADALGSSVDELIDSEEE
ncbi:MAG: helix-turn-helix transcriptional regulator, partial [Slackia sp.]|nr:helix-turn-helix transcriptional regulator [Slackia sp.]